MTRFRKSPEKQEEQTGDELMALLGFTVIRLSQPRASMVTVGLPDRLYYRPPRIGSKPSEALKLWWEAKAPKGVQSPAQRAFQALVESCGETYLCGTAEVLTAWAMERGLIR